ncbi:MULTISPECIES: NAD(P)/FAD-dependent oxidoreductase [Actinomadura]|uniref:NAD(P)/FAD-dependent oxidoreductase n=1 Tax=Actinomadura TaxID=1988 RepID=UPI0003F652FE|nr:MULTISPECIES: NAD(P)/FAD-dependent oxidoreductase [Actinomadura]RSN69968.1 NAD(P)/FAD-dependent oxidoreductase [Actinomadura sp. WAC 06369]
MSEHLGNEQREVLIIGGGPAGLSAALVLARARRRVTVVDSGEPRNATVAHMQGFLSRDGMPPEELRRIGRTEVRGYGGEIVDGAVERTERTAGGFAVTLRDGTVLHGRRLLVATGVVDELPDVPGLRERWGREVQMCPYCHGWEVRDQKIVVLATGPMSVHQALLLTQWSADVALVTAEAPQGADADRLAARGVTVVPGEPARLAVERDRVTGLDLAGGETVPCDAVFLGPRMVARSGPLTDLGCELTEDGQVKTDQFGLTSVPGVWAAGNVAKPAGQVIIAAADAVWTAGLINMDLIEEDIERELAARAA